MPGRQGYAVVSCHVERPHDDEVWQRYAALARARPAGFAITSIVRAPFDGEDRGRFLERAREAASFGPLGHHTHWTSPTDARPTGGDPAARVLEEGRWLREQGLEPRFFCGGNWYVDEPVLAAVAELGYADTTATAWAPRFLPGATLDQPAWVVLGDGRRVLELPTTHSLGELARSLARRLPPVVHVHFHDHDLLGRRYRAALRATLAALATRRRPTDLGALAAEREVPWADVCAA
jgi:hypothetical protein